MKPFNLDAAKAGAPVQLENGTPARIICFDRKGGSPIVALLGEGTNEHTAYFNNDGTCDCSFANFTLAMAPIKHEGWAILRKSRVCNTKPEAPDDFFIAKVEWEE